MKRIVAATLSIVLALMLFGCAKKDNEIVGISSTIAYAETTSDIAKAEIDGEYTFAFNPYVVSREAINAMKGNEHYNKFVSAVLNRASAVSVPTREEYDNIRFAIGEYFPFASLVENFRYSAIDMAVLIDYKYDLEEHNKKISDFKTEIENVFAQCVDRKDSSIIAAISLYNWISKNIAVATSIQSNDTTSSGIAQTETLPDISSANDIYSTLLTKKGNEKSASALYVFLLKQLGIDSKVVSGWSGEVFRTWNMVCLNNKWYHCDIYSEQKASDGEGLSYFGMTKSEIKDSISVSEICTGAFKWYTEKTPNASSKKFKDFRDVQSFSINSERNGIEAYTKEFSRFMWEI